MMVRNGCINDRNQVSKGSSFQAAFSGPGDFPARRKVFFTFLAWGVRVRGAATAWSATATKNGDVMKPPRSTNAFASSPTGAQPSSAIRSLARLKTIRLPISFTTRQRATSRIDGPLGEIWRPFSRWYFADAMEFFGSESQRMRMYCLLSLISYIPDRNRALTAVRGALNNSDDCRSPSAAKNLYFAALRRLAGEK